MGAANVGGFRFLPIRISRPGSLATAYVQPRRHSAALQLPRIGVQIPLIKVPAPNTENDDHNPPRIASRSLFDLSVGHDNLFHGDKYKWSAQLTVINLANNYALYNFLSTFSGTHYVTPRTLTAELGFHF
jgi:hypothetical protein